MFITGNYSSVITQGGEKEIESMNGYTLLQITFTVQKTSILVEFYVFLKVCSLINIIRQLNKKLISL